MGSLAWVFEVSPGVELDVELWGADINFNLLIEGCFIPWRKWWKKLRGREDHTTMRNHDMQSVFILSTAGKVLRSLAQGRLL